MHIFIKTYLPNLFMEWTLQYIFSCNYYKYVTFGLGLGFVQHINKLTKFSQIYSNKHKLG